MMLRHEGFEDKRAHNALDMLLVDRKNEFRELAATIFAGTSGTTMPVEDQDKFILNFCLDVNKAFKSWSGEIALTPNSEKQALIILRQLSRDKKAMNELVHLLNIAYNLAEEFKVVYRRIE